MHAFIFVETHTILHFVPFSTQFHFVDFRPRGDSDTLLSVIHHKSACGTSVRLYYDNQGLGQGEFALIEKGSGVVEAGG